MTKQARDQEISLGEPESWAGSESGLFYWVWQGPLTDTVRDQLRQWEGYGLGRSGQGVCRLPSSLF